MTFTVVIVEVGRTEGTGPRPVNWRGQEADQKDCTVAERIS